MHPAVWPQQKWAENWGGAPPPFVGGGRVPIEHKVAWAEAYLHAKYQLHPSSRSATINMGRKFWGSAPFWGGERCPHLTQSRLGRGLPARQVSSWSVQPFGHSARTSQTGQTNRQTDRTNNGPL